MTDKSGLWSYPPASEAYAREVETLARQVFDGLGWHAMEAFAFEHAAASLVALKRQHEPEWEPPERQTFDAYYRRDNGRPYGLFRRGRVQFDRDGRAITIELHAEPGEELSTRSVRAMPVHQFISEARRSLLERAEWERANGLDGLVDQGEVPIELSGVDTMMATSLRQRPGRGGRPDIEYARVAQVYAELVDASPERPIERLAERFSVSKSTARNWMHEARRRGLSTSNGRGRGGGQLTDRARDLLDGGQA